jgi:subtilisin-like proprotein convertase family protein
MPIRPLVDARIRTFTTALDAQPAGNRAINEQNVLQLMAAVGDKSGVSFAQAQTYLGAAGRTRQEQFDHTRAGMSQNERADLATVLDNPAYTFTAGARNFLEALVGRATFNPALGGNVVVTPPPGPFAPTGTAIKQDATKAVSTASHDIQLATVVGNESIPDFKLTKRTIADPQERATVITAPANLGTITTAAAFKTAMMTLQTGNATYIRPDQAALKAALPEADRTQYAVINIAGRRVQKFFDEAALLIDRTGMNATEKAAARKDLNEAFRDAFRNRDVKFDLANTGTYWSYGNDAAFVHVYEKMLESLPEDSPKRQYVQNQIDYLFTHKYAPGGNVDEKDIEDSLKLVAIDKSSRQTISVKPGTESLPQPSYETLVLPARPGSREAERNVFRDGAQVFLAGTRTEVPAADVGRVVATPVSREDIVFRRKANTEQLRQDFPLDWDGNGWLNPTNVDTSWWGHCDIKAIIETVMADMAGSGGVAEYRTDTKRKTEFSRDMQLEALASLLNMGSEYANNVNQIVAGNTEFAGARYDNRPTVMSLVANRNLQLPIRLTNLSEKARPGVNVDLDKVFATKVADADQRSFTANPDLVRVDQGDMNTIDATTRKISATTDGWSFDQNGLPIEQKAIFELDPAATTGARFMVGSQMIDVNARTVDRFYYDPATKNLSSVRTQWTKDGQGRFNAVEGTATAMGRLQRMELSREMMSGDDVPGKIRMLDNALKTGGKIATDSDPRQEVWNGEVHALRYETEWRSPDGLWERVAVHVDATFGNGKMGTLLHKLDTQGRIVDSMELSAAVDFYWKDEPRVAPLISERGNWMVNSEMYRRGVVVLDTPDAKLASVGALQDLNDLIFLGLKGKNNAKTYTLVHEGKRFVYNDKAAWDADIARFEGAGVGGTGGGGTPPPNKVLLNRVANATIPDNDMAGITDTIDVAAAGTVKDIKIRIDLRHTYVGDLDVKLTAPDGTSVKLHARGGTDADDLVGTYGTDLVATEDLRGLIGKNVTGAWKLQVVDLAGQDVGNLREWALDIDT